jgi:hypothetical protein
VPTQPLDQGHCRVADAIDRKQHGVGAADVSLQQPSALLDTTVVMQQGRTGALGQHPQVNDLSLPAPDIKKCQI